MDFVSGFHLEEKDDKLFLVYHHSKYHPIPQTLSPTPSINNHLLQPLFLCPSERQLDAYFRNDSHSLFPIDASPEYLLPEIKYSTHSVLPLFWCNNKEFEDNGGCKICEGSNFGTDYYFCDDHNERYHRECVQSPLKIKSPYHPEHSLQLFFSRSYMSSNDRLKLDCLCCGKKSDGLLYHCGICKVFMHTVCAMKPIPFVIDQSKRHDHPLTFFHRKTSLVCNVCGLLRKHHSTYICVKCNLVAHKDCSYFPRIIKISRHPHRLSHTSSLRSGEWSCGVCRKNIDGDYGAYTCDKCCDYVVHSICAVGKDVWDGEDLEDVLEEDDITPYSEPFDVISEGVILHFLHVHHLCLQVSILYDENKFCQACVLPIFEGNFYSCNECDFILHETCAKSRCKIQHALHPQPLTLKLQIQYDEVSVILRCDACYRFYGGFYYGCLLRGCAFRLDIQCASISEPLDYEGHEHPLYLALNPEEKPICHGCKIECHKQLNCIICDFIICIKCASLPYRVRFKHEKHFLRVLFGEEVCEKSWCEVCEQDLRDTNTNVIYCCDECCTTVHVECLFGNDPYLKPGQFIENLIFGIEDIKILRKINTSRPLCTRCKNRCQDKIFMRDENFIACSMRCLNIS